MRAKTRTIPMTDPEPESVRWVRYAADCAERVLPLTGLARPQAEATIAAARAWADCPCSEHERAATDAAWAIVPPARDAAYAAAYAAWAAWVAAAAAEAAGAAKAAEAAALAAHDPETERSWQAERRKHYGLPGGKA